MPPRTSATARRRESDAPAMAATEIRYEIADATGSASLRCLFMLASHYQSQQPATYEHPRPPYVRLFLFRSGGAVITAAGRDFCLKPGVIYLIPDRQDFRAACQAADFLFYHLRVTDGAGFSIFTEKPGVLAHDDSRLFAAIVSAHTGNESALRNVLLFEAVTRFALPQLKSAKTRKRAGGKFDRLLEIIARTEDLAALRVNRLAKLVKMGRTTLSTDFHAKMGISLKDYLQGIVLIRGEDCLLHTDLPAREIAAHLGFRDPTHFHRFFRQRTGLTPARFRDAHKHGGPAQPA